MSDKKNSFGIALCEHYFGVYFTYGPHVNRSLEKIVKQKLIRCAGRDAQ